MISEMITITNPSGLHARPAGVFAKEASKHKCDVLIRKQGKEFDAKSILGVLSACIKSGTQIELCCSGADEQEAMEALKQAIASGLGE